MTNTATVNFQTELKDQYFKSDFDVKSALDLFKENLDKAKTIRKDGNTIILIDDNKKIIGAIFFQNDIASIINTDNISLTCIKTFQPHAYSTVSDIFNQILTKFEYNSSLLNNN